MRKILVILALLLGCISQALAISIISGKWNGIGNMVYFYEVKDGQLKEKASYVVDADKNFGFAVNIEKEGFYAIGIQYPQATVGKFMFYLKPNDNLNVDFTAEDYELVGENTSESKNMKEWFDLVKPVYAMSSLSRPGKVPTYVEFFPTLEAVIEVADNKTYTATGNSVFDNAFANFRKYDLAANALGFLFYPNTAFPQDEDYPDYYSMLSFKELCSEDDLMNYPFGNRLLSSIEKQKVMTQRKNSNNTVTPNNSLLKENLSEVGSTLLQGELALMSAQRIQTVEGLLEFKKEFGKYITTDNQNDRFKELLNNKAKNAKGDPAIDFKFPDVNGKEIALSDFKGKVVYVDIWATWCGPCLKEIPHLKKLEADYHGKNIVFMGVSVDAQKDHEKWKKFLETNGMKGVQIFAGDKKDDISNPYKVKGIPRFLLIGKDGRIVSDNAPRPSSDEIRLLINGALNKK